MGSKLSWSARKFSRPCDEAPTAVLTVVKMPEMSNEQHWSTSEVAKDLGVSPSLVRTWIAYLNWEVRRNAEGHRIFVQEDVEQLKSLKAWLDEGHSLKEFRRERLGEGVYDPRVELKASFRRLRELQSQEDALIAKQIELVETARAQREALMAQISRVRADIDALESPEAGPAEPTAGEPVDTSKLVQSVLKQLLTSLLEKQGKLQLVRRYEEGGRPLLEYASPTGKRQVIDDVCQTDDDRKLLETVLTIILNG